VMLAATGGAEQVQTGATNRENPAHL